MLKDVLTVGVTLTLFLLIPRSNAGLLRILEYVVCLDNYEYDENSTEIVKPEECGDIPTNTMVIETTRTPISATSTTRKPLVQWNQNVPKSNPYPNGPITTWEPMVRPNPEQLIAYREKKTPNVPWTTRKPHQRWNPKAPFSTRKPKEKVDSVVSYEYSDPEIFFAQVDQKAPKEPWTIRKPHQHWTPKAPFSTREPKALNRS
nr:uncharacterized protein LOC106690742 [Halyomorpha halys]